MTDLTTTAQSLKKIGTVLAVLLIIILLVGAIIFRVKKQEIRPSATPIPINPPQIRQDPSQKSPSTIDFSQIQSLNIPKELPAYATDKYNLTDQSVKTLAHSFGITNPPTVIEEDTHDGKQYNWESGNSRLTASQTALRYESKTQTIETKGSFSQDELLDKALSFTQKIPVIDKEVTYNSQKTRYLNISNGRLASASSFENAQIVEFSFDKKLSSLPILGQSPDSNFVKIRMEKNGSISYLSARFFSKFTEQNLHKVKTQKEATEEVRRGQGKIIQTLILDENGQALELFRAQSVDIKTAIITNVSLAYFLPSDLGEPIQPIFVFEGNFKKGNETGKVVIYLPALKT